MKINDDNIFQTETATNGHKDVSSQSTPDGSETVPEDQVIFFFIFLEM